MSISWNYWISILKKLLNLALLAKTINLKAMRLYWFLALLLIWFIHPCNAKQTKPQIIDGVLDLSDWNFQEQGITHLDGAWYFYWDQLFTSVSEIDKVNSKSTCVLTQFWTEGNSDETMKDKPFGVATYHLRVLLPDSIQAYYLKINAINNAYALWANQQLLTEIGKVGRSRESTIPHFKTQLVALPRAKTVDLFLQTANWEHRLGSSAFKPILIGTENQIRKLWQVNYSVELSLSSIIFFISLFSILLYYFNKEQKSYLYLAFFVIFGAIRIICVDEMVIQDIIPNLSSLLNQQIRYIGFSMSGGFLILYMHELLKDIAFKYFFSFFYIGITLSLATIILPFKWASYVPFVYIITATPFTIYGIYINIKALVFRTRVPVLFIVMNIMICSHHLYSIFIFRNNVQSGYYSHHLLYLLFLLGLSVIIIAGHIQINLRTKKLTIELTDLNKNLEQKVEDRTIEIRNQQEELIAQRDHISIQADKLQLANKQLQELDQSKTRFFANISHELRTPLTVILGNLDRLRKQDSNINQEQVLDAAERNTKQLQQLVNQLLDITKLEDGKMKLKVQEEDIVHLLKGYLFAFHSLAEQKGIKLNFQSNIEIAQTYIDKSVVEKIAYNLISNALKFTPNGGQVFMDITVNDQQTTLIVKDTGIGIPQDKLPHIFDRFFQVETAVHKVYEGTGIGLALVKELVELHKGNIQVESTEGKGTTFTLTLASSQTVFTAKELVKNEPDLPKEQTITPVLAIRPSDDKKERVVLDESKPILLIVEDHADLQELIKQNLSDAYQIIQAYDGEQGAEMAFEHIPDLIISDVMMPKKNGFELCEQLKTDKRTSHIPIVMLTARVEQADKLQGLEIGADDYLAKPFDGKELKIRVHNLIQIRRKLKEQFAEKTEFVIYNPKEVEKNAVDNQFMEQLLEVLEQNYTDELFSVDDLADAIGLSKRQLNRKLKAMIDSSASKIMQNFRLQKSIDLLHDASLRKGDIAFMVGFASVTYFNKCFKDKFGKTPNEYQAELLGKSL